MLIILKPYIFKIKFFLIIINICTNKNIHIVKNLFNSNYINSYICFNCDGENNNNRIWNVFVRSEIWNIYEIASGCRDLGNDTWRTNGSSYLDEISVKFKLQEINIPSEKNMNLMKFEEFYLPIIFIIFYKTIKFVVIIK